MSWQGGRLFRERGRAVSFCSLQPRGFVTWKNNETAHFCLIRSGLHIFNDIDQSLYTGVSNETPDKCQTNFKHFQIVYTRGVQFRVFLGWGSTALKAPLRLSFHWKTFFYEAGGIWEQIRKGCEKLALLSLLWWRPNPEALRGLWP